MLFIATNYYFDSKEIPLNFQCKYIDIFLNLHTNLQSSFKEDWYYHKIAMISL